MMLRSRSCVIGRGVAMFSICSAIAFASKMPTQIGSTRSPSLSRRITIGMFVIGSTISPLIDISICMTAYNLCPGWVPVKRRAPPHAVRARPLDPDPQRPANPLRRPGQIDDHVAAGPARELDIAPPAGGIDQDRHLAADERRV